MSLRIRTITFDCNDPYRQAAFWGALTGYVEDPSNRNYPEDEEAVIRSTDASASLLFIRVPEPKQLKNRVHLDLCAEDSSPGSRDREVERALSLGASLAEDHRRPDGTGWMVLADPDGNEFCIERGVSGG